MTVSPSRPQLGSWRDTLLVGIAVTFVAAFAMWRMGYLSAATSERARLTDNTRSAYVAKNLVEGRGYTTNDLPASLLDFYDREGRLDDAHWENADRFPFTTYAIAALYTVTGSTRSEVGVTLYNFLTFVGYMLALFVLARMVWGERVAALLAVALALMHPYTYLFLYLKDADTQLLSTTMFATLWLFALRPAHQASRRLQIGMGTVLGWLFLARPNVGAAFVLVLAFLGARQAWRDRQSDGLGHAARRLLRGYGLPALTMILWCLPFAIDTTIEWGTPFFSANNKYQLPLGTRFGMGTDTWWKYTEPGQSITLGEMWRLAPDDMTAKLTTSWLTTFKWILMCYAVELIAALAVLVWLRRRPGATDEAPSKETAARRNARPTILLFAAAGFTVIFNLAVLPLYAYKNYAFVHYLSFALPVVWMGAGMAAAAVLRTAAQAWPRICAHVAERREVYTVAALLVLLVWGLGATNTLTNPWFIRPARHAGRHWLLSMAVIATLIAFRQVVRPVGFARGVIIVVIFVLARYRADIGVLRTQRVFFPISDRPGEVLRERQGQVSSLALQGEVAWMSGRRNVPVPEYALHLYSYRFDHRLVIEDVYLESAEAMVSAIGPFGLAAPGFETYARMQRYGGTFPGYERVLHETAMLRYDQKGTPLPKASSIYRLVDPAAADRMAESPTVIELGRLENIVHTAYGFEGYVEIDGRAAVVTSDAIARRYQTISEVPAEDVGVTYFVGDREPRAIDLAVYGTGPATIWAYQNVDLFSYTRASEVPSHLVATTELTGGWQTVHIELPHGKSRRGLNKLGFKVSQVQPTVLCPPQRLEQACLQAPFPLTTTERVAPRLVRTTGGELFAVRTAMALGTMTFHY